VRPLVCMSIGHLIEKAATESGYHRADNNEVTAPQIAAQTPSDRSTVTIKDARVSG
jgi:hypothetical protein